MDFGFKLEANPVFCPRHYEWQSDVIKEEFKSAYALVGAGRELGKLVFVDGVNEHGLAGAALYLPGEVAYNQEIIADKVNLAPHEVLYWVLSNCRNLAEVTEQIKKLNIMDTPISLLGITTPLHWIFSDKSGETFVVEPTTLNLSVTENPVGVMTNSPQMSWHINNLRNYLNLSPQQQKTVSFGNYLAAPFSQGSGTFGLPGGYTPPERFVRTAFLREYLEKTSDYNQTLSAIWYIMNSVWIPKGAVVKEDGEFDYTQYGAAMDVTSLIYYFTPYGNSTINGIRLTKELIENMETPKVFSVPTKQAITFHN